jgi:hypothetical protein
MMPIHVVAALVDIMDMARQIETAGNRSAPLLTDAYDDLEQGYGHTIARDLWVEACFQYDQRHRDEEAQS